MRPAPPSRVSLWRVENILSAKIDVDLALWALGRAVRGSAAVAAKAEPEPERGEGEEGADGVEQGIVRGRRTAGDESLMDLVEAAVAGGNHQRGYTPAPMPSAPPATHRAKQQQAEHKIFGEVRAFANDVMDEIELVRGDGREKPAQDRLND